jgi:hypothetical protein
MKRIARRKVLNIVILFLLASAYVIAQAPAQVEHVMRSIRIIPYSTSRKGLPPILESVQRRLSRIPLAVELKFTEETLIDALGKVDKTIQEVYGENGASVRVEHEVTGAPAGTELTVRVIELCTCEK